MTALTDLPVDLVDDMISRVPITRLRSVRSTCKDWNAFTKTRILGEAGSGRKPFMGFLTVDFTVCSMKFDLEGTQNDEGDFIDPSISIKEVSELDEIYISEIFHCNGLLLCVCKKNERKVLAWNPYLKLKKWIRPRKPFDILNVCALGYDHKSKCHKILNGFSQYQIYDFSSNSWKDLDVSHEYEIRSRQGGVTVKGNAYFVAQRVKKDRVQRVKYIEVFLLCFDFTRERFRSPLTLPFNVSVDENEDEEPNEIVTLSCVGDERLAVLHVQGEKMQIWITTKIKPKAVSWSKFLKVDLMELNCLPVNLMGGSFFIDEEKHIAVVFDLQKYERTETSRCHKAYIVGEDGYIKTVSLEEALKLEEPDEEEFGYRRPLLCSSPYVPSLVKLQNNQPAKRKRREVISH